MTKRGVAVEYIGPISSVTLAYERAQALRRHTEKGRLEAWLLLQRLTARVTDISASALVANWETHDEAVKHARWLEHFYRRQWEAERVSQGFPRVETVETRMCPVCRQVKPLTLEYFHRERNRWWKARCRECRREYDRKRWTRRKIEGKATPRKESA